jgi:NhaP-type Na+/H+ or K+/H+ antiporter
MGTGSSTISDDDSVRGSQSKKRYSTRIGMLLAACGSLIWIASVTKSLVDPNVTEHKSIYPFAVMLVCAFCVFVFIVSVAFGALIGRIVGSLLSRTGDRNTTDNSPRATNKDIH